MRFLLKGGILLGALISSFYSVEGVVETLMSLQENCDLGGSCNSNSKCIGAGVTGLCSLPVKNNYAVTWNGTISGMANPLSLSHMNFPFEATSTIYNVLNEGGYLFAQIFVGELGAGLVVLDGPISSVPETPIKQMSNFYSTPSRNPVKLEIGTSFTIYLTNISGKLTLLMEWGGKNASNQLVEMGGVDLVKSSFSISSIIVASGPQSVKSQYSQLWDFSPKYQSYTFPTKFTDSDNGLSNCIGYMYSYCLDYVYQYSYEGIPWSEGLSFYIAQGITTNNLVYTFKSGQTSVLTLTMFITSDRETKLTFSNLVTKESNSIILPAQYGHQNPPTEGFIGGLIGLRLFVSGGQLLLGFDDEYMLGINIKGLNITSMSSPVWYTLTTTSSYLTPLDYNKSVGDYIPCPAAESSNTCTGTEYVINEPLKIGNKISFLTSYAPQGNNVLPKRIPTLENIFGAITASDYQRLRIAVTMQESAISLISFDPAGIVVDTCTGLLLEEDYFLSKSPLNFYLVVDNSNNIAVGSDNSKTGKLYCKIPLGNIELTKFKVNTGFLEGNSVTFNYTSNFNLLSQETIADNAPESSTCYLGANGKCEASYIVEYTNSGFGQGSYSLIESKNVQLPLFIEMISTTSGELILEINISVNAVISINNLVSNVSDSAILPIVCYSSIITNGFSAVLSGNNNELTLVTCGEALLTISSEGLNIPLSVIFSNKNNLPGVKHNSVFPAFSLVSFESNITKPIESTSGSTNSTESYPTIIGCTISNFGESCFGSELNIGISQSPRNNWVIYIQGTVSPIIGKPEIALERSINPENVVQIFDIMYQNDATSLEIILSKNFLSFYDYQQNLGCGGNLPNNIVLSNGDNYRLKIVYIDDQIYSEIEYPFNSNIYYILGIPNIHVHSNWYYFILQTSYNLEKMLAIKPKLPTFMGYTFKIVDSYIGTDHVTPYLPSGVSSCQINLYGICRSIETILPLGGALQGYDIQLLEGVIYNNELIYVFYDNTGLAVITVTIKIVVSFWIYVSKINLKNYAGDEVTLIKGTSPVGVFTRALITTNTFFFTCSNNEVAISLRGKKYSKIVVESGAWYTTKMTRNTINGPQPSIGNYHGKLANELAASDLAFFMSDCSGPIVAKTSQTYIKCTPNASINRVEFNLVMPEFVEEVLTNSFSSIPGYLQGIVFTFNSYQEVYTIFIGKGFVSIASYLDAVVSPIDSCGGVHLNNTALSFGDDYVVGIQNVGNKIELYEYLNGIPTLICSINSNIQFNVVKLLEQMNGNTTEIQMKFDSTIKLSPAPTAKSIVPYATVINLSTIPVSAYTTVLNPSSFVLNHSPTNDQITYEFSSNGDSTYSIIVSNEELFFRSTLTSNYTVSSIPNGCFSNSIMFSFGILSDEFVITGCNKVLGQLPIFGNIFDTINVSEGTFDLSWIPDIRYLQADGNLYQLLHEKETVSIPIDQLPKGKLKVQQFSIISSLHTVP